MFHFKTTGYEKYFIHDNYCLTSDRLLQLPLRLFAGFVEGGDSSGFGRLLLGDAYLPVGYYEQYNSSVAQPYNTFIHMMSDEIQQNRSTNENEHSAMLSSEDMFGYFT